MKPPAQERNYGKAQPPPLPRHAQPSLPRTKPACSSAKAEITFGDNYANGALAKPGVSLPVARVTGVSS
ncbi:hypothetical protein SKAU_G00327990 [Synaphobranchus kaupii]|uniref:Uncharacterized protein n=1 Tax=Synaphobranchus kaupii TaxID=118154 RepID=A0A9Q1IKG0_SYNKA|nr:hypothetical protein SKAU_G00327990 [Synaphobranchus kaupii]